MLPVAVKLPVEGSYRSALDNRCSTVEPPAIRTLPSRRSVAVFPSRGLIMLPVGVKVPVCCPKATLQNNRTRTDCNEPNLLVIFIPRFTPRYTVTPASELLNRPSEVRL